MKIFPHLLSIITLITFPLKSTRYLYPVASYNDGNTILLIQQESPNTIQLLSWDSNKKHSTECLWSLFRPAGLQLLPDESGFSFIDNGRLRIKYFNKRSAQSIDFDEYFYMINSVNWINSKECYCSAKTSDYYAIFHCTIDGYSCCTVSSNKANCLYPQKVNTHLFYIEESYNEYPNQKEHYCIKHMTYPIIKYDDTQSYSETKNIPQKIIDFQNKPIIFLHMISEREGFVIEHARNIHDNDINSTFLYHQLLKNKGDWSSKLLFSFNIPTNLFIRNNEHCLYESLLPLTPRVIGTKIYFVDTAYNLDNTLESYTYDIKSAAIQKNKHIHVNSFVPMLCGKNIVIGGAIDTPSNLQVFNFLT